MWPCNDSLTPKYLRRIVTGGVLYSFLAVWLLLLTLGLECRRWLFVEPRDSYEWHYSTFSLKQRQAAKLDARRMFEFAFDNYMTHAYPLDELDPINCVGRGPDFNNPSNININDVLGGYSLSLIDSLSTLIVMGNRTKFRQAVWRVIDHVTFDTNSTVQVFEATIRVLGALLSAHLIITDTHQTLGDFRLPGYDNQLLTMAHDLANRLLAAFENTKTGLPYPRVNLKYGVNKNIVNETCTAGAGSLLLEFGVLSRLLGDPVYENLARRTNKILWKLRDKETGLLGNVVDIQTGEWVGLLSGLGAGLDSYYEYLLKAYVLFGDPEDYNMFNQSYTNILEYHRRGRNRCTSGQGEHPLYVNVHMKDGTLANTWIDSLQASFSGVQILNGDIDEAICQHAYYYGIWKKYGVLPERYNWKLNAPDVLFYPLRPEFVESTYLLYRTTRSPFYLHVGREIIDNLNAYTKAECGYATVHSVHDKSLEDRMESFFLSETCKYLYLLFDEDNPVNKNYERILFTTEGHILIISDKFRQPNSVDSPLEPDPKWPFSGPWLRPSSRLEEEEYGRTNRNDESNVHVIVATPPNNASQWELEGGNRAECQAVSPASRFAMPIPASYLRQMYASIGLPDYL